jgi:exosortase A-associated hydrolase 1
VTLVHELPLQFDCQQQALAAILSLPQTCSSAKLAMVVVVGGPQYRVGSHRQFVLLARAVAAAGFPVLRFDTRGMGDSEGEFPGFEALTPDIAAAVAALRHQLPELEQIVLWGLCDGASAILLSLPELKEVTATVLLNPWVRDAQSAVRTEVRHYYKDRLLQAEFWLKLLRGGVNIRGALREFLAKLRQLRQSRPAVSAAAPSCYQDQMAAAAQQFTGPSLVILSGQDYVAREFEDCVRERPAWQGFWQASQRQRFDLAAADHTFSSATWRAEVEQRTLSFLQSLL